MIFKGLIALFITHLWYFCKFSIFRLLHHIIKKIKCILLIRQLANSSDDIIIKQVENLMLAYVAWHHMLILLLVLCVVDINPGLSPFSAP